MPALVKEGELRQGQSAAAGVEWDKYKTEFMMLASEWGAKVLYTHTPANLSPQSWKSVFPVTAGRAV
jgi:hypothetical protein